MQLISHLQLKQAFTHLFQSLHLRLFYKNTCSNEIFRKAPFTDRLAHDVNNEVKHFQGDMRQVM